MESSPDNAVTGWHCQTARVRQARREGVTRVNQWLNPRNEAADSNLADMGRFVAGAEHLGCEARPGGARVPRPEVTLKVCGVSVAIATGEELDTAPADRETVNMGTATWPAVCPRTQLDSGQARRRLEAAWWGGVAVVVRGRESRPHGEGRQPFRSRSAGRPGVRW